MTTSRFGQEWRLFRREKQTWVMFALFFVLALYAVQNGRERVEREKQTVVQSGEKRKAFLDSLEQLAKKEELKLDSLRKPLEPPSWGVRHPYFANFLTADYAALPVSNLAALSIGQSDLQNPLLLIRLDSEREVFNHDESDLQNPLKMKIGAFDFAFVVIYLLPLLILALSFNLLSSEKETGVLSLVLSQPVSIAELVRVKVWLYALILLGFAEAVVVVAFVQSGASFQTDVSRLLLLMLSVGLYGLFWFSLAVCVSAFGKNSATNALILAACWLWVLVVAPSALNGIANLVYPLPSRVGYVNALRQAGEDAERRSAKRMEQFYQDHPELAKDTAARDNDFGIKYLLMLSDISLSTKTVRETFNAQRELQTKLVKTLQAVSPAVVMQSVLNTISGTSDERYANFLRQAKAFHKVWCDYFEPMIYQRKAFSNYSQIPVFSYQEETEGEVAIQVLRLSVLWIIPTVVLLICSNARFKTYSVVEGK
ncbi:MAG: DUF3526 domain-containing protein [Chlorobiales bacterium]